MISIDEHPPPDPSSSDNQIHHLQQQLSHEAFASVSDIDLLLKPSDGNLDDTNNNSPLPNFSIRWRTDWLYFIINSIKTSFLLYQIFVDWWFVWFRLSLTSSTDFLKKYWFYSNQDGIFICLTILPNPF